MLNKDYLKTLPRAKLEALDVGTLVVIDWDNIVPEESIGLSALVITSKTEKAVLLHTPHSDYALEEPFILKPSDVVYFVLPSYDPEVRR